MTRQYTIKRLGGNVREVRFENGIIEFAILISYETPVAVRLVDRFGAFHERTSTRWSRSTEGHIQKWICDWWEANGRGEWPKVGTIGQDELWNLLEEVTGVKILTETRAKDDRPHSQHDGE